MYSCLDSSGIASKDCRRRIWLFRRDCVAFYSLGGFDPRFHPSGSLCHLVPPTVSYQLVTTRGTEPPKLGQTNSNAPHRLFKARPSLFYCFTHVFKGVSYKRYKKMSNKPWPMQRARGDGRRDHFSNMPEKPPFLGDN